MATKIPAKREAKKPAQREEKDFRPHAVMARKAAMKARKAAEPTAEAAAIAASQVAAVRAEKLALKGC